MTPEIIWFLVALAVAALFAGFIAGLFGVGGGVVIVPALYGLFTAMGVDEAVRMHVAVGTSLSTIITTSWRSLATHAKAGAVDFAVLKQWSPWIAVGALVGAAVAGLANTMALMIIFGFGLLLIALQFGFGNPDWRVRDDLPVGGLRAFIASLLGGLSSIMGIGGGAFGVTVMTLCNRPIHQAVATASGFGAAIAIPGTVGFIIAGLGREGLPPWSVGFVNVPGFILLALLTATTAPIGARLAHRLPQLQLKRAFGAMLAFVALNMLRVAFS